ncbi:MAG: hypothetical protein ACTHLB_10780 [Parafilimonas sp.]
MQQAVKNTNSWLLRGYLIEVTGKKSINIGCIKFTTVDYWKFGC